MSTTCSRISTCLFSASSRAGPTTSFGRWASASAAILRAGFVGTQGLDENRNDLGIADGGEKPQRHLDLGRVAAVGRFEHCGEHLLALSRCQFFHQGDLHLLADGLLVEHLLQSRVAQSRHLGDHNLLLGNVRRFRPLGDQRGLLLLRSGGKQRTESLPAGRPENAWRRPGGDRSPSPCPACPPIPAESRSARRRIPSERKPCRPSSSHRSGSRPPRRCRSCPAPARRPRRPPRPGSWSRR